jgi:hypothetical protein
MDKPPKATAKGRITDPDAAARKLVEIANGVEAVMDGRQLRRGFGPIEFNNPSVISDVGFAGFLEHGFTLLTCW